MHSGPWSGCLCFGCSLAHIVWKMFRAEQDDVARNSYRQMACSCLPRRNQVYACPSNVISRAPLQRLTRQPKIDADFAKQQGSYPNTKQLGESSQHQGSNLHLYNSSSSNFKQVDRTVQSEESIAGIARHDKYRFWLVTYQPFADQVIFAQERSNVAEPMSKVVFASLSR